MATTFPLSWPSGARERDDPFARAERHSRRVRVLRRAIPLVCVGLCVLPIAVRFVAPLAGGGPDVSVGAVSVSGSTVRMEQPRLSGFRRDQRSYLLTADEALQDIRTPTVVELNRLSGNMERSQGVFARLTADWGRFDQTANRLDVKGEVRLRTDDGYEADLRSARVDMRTGDIMSVEPVEIRSRTGTINAERMTIRENGRHAVFEGRVRSVFIQQEPAAEEGARP